MPSSVSGSLSAGAQLLANDKLQLPGSSQPQTGGAALDQGVSKTTAVPSIASHGTVSASSTSADGDTVELSAEALQMLQQMGEFGTAAAHSSHPTQPYAAAAYESFDYFG